jgi:hypothetical protein
VLLVATQWGHLSWEEMVGLAAILVMSCSYIIAFIFDEASNLGPGTIPAGGKNEPLRIFLLIFGVLFFVFGCVAAHDIY